MTEKLINWFKADAPEFDKVPKKPGIYIISTRQSNHEYEVKYVGQAASLYDRVNEHWSKKEKNKELKQHIAEKFLMKFNYALIESQAERDGMELYLYNYYQPQLNKDKPSGKTVISCTVPSVSKHH